MISKYMRELVRVQKIIQKMQKLEETLKKAIMEATSND